MRGAAAIADAVVGVYSPAGRSPVTWYASDAALPADRGEMSPYPSDTSPGTQCAGVGPVPLGRHLYIVNDAVEWDRDVRHQRPTSRSLCVQAHFWGRLQRVSVTCPFFVTFES
jgi:hypothetical protein